MIYRIANILIDIKGLQNEYLEHRLGAYLETDTHTMLADELLAISQRYEYTLPILVPCSQKYEMLVNELSDRLESEFVICNADRIFSDSPLADIP